MGIYLAGYGCAIIDAVIFDYSFFAYSIALIVHVSRNCGMLFTYLALHLSSVRVPMMMIVYFIMYKVGETLLSVREFKLLPNLQIWLCWVGLRVVCLHYNTSQLLLFTLLSFMSLPPCS